MKLLLSFSIFVIFVLRFCDSQRTQNHGNLYAGNRQVGVGGLSFAIPGLSLLAGNNGAGGNFFGPATVTRTIVSTVSTVTTASFRTCIVATTGLMPCVSGRRKRGLGINRNAVDQIKIEATPAMQVIVGQTTIRDPDAVAEYLEDHKPSSQSVIYPPDYQPRDHDETTPLYPSQDTPDTTEGDVDVLFDGENDVDSLITTETPVFLSDDSIDTTTSTGENDTDLNDNEKARVGLGRTSTTTTIIRVTSVATSLATGTSATLSISYMGCLPPSLPISGPVCQ